MKKRVAILGSTGSIGRTALEVIRHLGPEIQVVALVAKSNIDLLEKQAREFKPQYVALFDKEAAYALKKRLPEFSVLAGEEAICEIASLDCVDFVLSAISGFSAIRPTIAAIEKGKVIGLANKEVLVAAGTTIMNLVKIHNSLLIPIDSEQSAIFQCLEGKAQKDVKKLILTASGGPFHKKKMDDLIDIDVAAALAHPNYRMGAKLTIDSSTLMNKGLEMIEAHHLFHLAPEAIEVLVHPEQIVHGFVEMIDGSIFAQLSEPNMALPILYALTYPGRASSPLTPFDWKRHSSWHFTQVDSEKFPCFSLAKEALHQGGSLPCFMSGANEVLVERFLQKQISWLDIGKKLDRLMTKHKIEKEIDLEKVFLIDEEARRQASIV